jgi:hypothetical protein
MAGSCVLVSLLLLAALLGSTACFPDPGADERGQDMPQMLINRFVRRYLYLVIEKLFSVHYSTAF